MEKKWTEGPWGKESFALSEEIFASGNKLVAIVQSRHCDSPEEMRANAHLIAAAPELYEALEKMCSNALELGYCHMADCHNCNSMKALAKALCETGGENGR